MQISSSPSPFQARQSDPSDRSDKSDPSDKSDKSDKAAEDPKVQAQVADLRRRDQEVRAHEAAHAAAGGGYVHGGPSFQYATGPDGKRYAVGGEVQIDTSAVSGDPAATAAKMRVVRSAALAPANPSGQDLHVAAAASQAEAQARMEAAVAALDTGRAAGATTPKTAPKGARVDRYA